MQLLDVRISARLGTLQSLDDAIAYRASRLDLPCTDCTTQQQCAEHAQDTRLLENYQKRYIEVFEEAVADMDPADIARVLEPDDGMPPLSHILALSLAAYLRKLTADGPVRTSLDGRTVVIDRDGPRLIEYPATGLDGHGRSDIA